MNKSKVAIVKCTSYNTEEVKRAVAWGIELLGGIEQFVQPDEKILLKPNLLRGRAPDKAVTTHPSVFSAVIEMLQKNGCKNLSYGDSPGYGAPEKVAKEAGLQTVAETAGIKMLEFSKGEATPFPEGQICKQFELARGVLESDAIISLSKMKTHKLTRITGAVKNQLGCVYGFNKGASHAKYPNSLNFSKMLVDLNKMLAPRLFIMDGIVAMEGDGPGSGTPVLMNVLLFSNDPVALDATFARLINLDPANVPTIVYGDEMGLGHSAEAQIELLGEPMAGLINENFDVDRIPVKNESFADKEFRLSKLSKIRGLITRKPIIEKERCVACGICIESCPLQEKALSWSASGAGDKRIPQYDYSQCIRCYCCQEMCPKQAISVKTPLLGKLFIYH